MREPVCRGECRRTAADPVRDSPASLVEVRPGRKVLTCGCCFAPLEYVPEQDARSALGPQVMDATASTSMVRLYRCAACGYDVRLLKDLVPA